MDISHCVSALLQISCTFQGNELPVLRFMASVWDDIVDLVGYLHPFWYSDLITWFHLGGDTGSHTRYLPVQSKERK